MAVDDPDVDRAARAAAGTINVEPRQACEDGCPDRWRPQRALTGRDGGVPPPDDAHRIFTGSLLGCAGAHIEGEAFDAGRVVLGHSASTVAPAAALPEVSSCPPVAAPILPARLSATLASLLISFPTPVH